MTTEGPIANILHQDTIRRLAGDRTFERGQAYYQDGRVVELARSGPALGAKVRGERTYEVRLWVKDDNLAYHCTCPLGQEQTFCKHAVAVSLAWLGKPEARLGAGDPVAAALDSIPRTGLVELLSEEAATNPRLRERILERGKK
jgi:uncharacterized Zn finger protein